MSKRLLFWMLLGAALFAPREAEADELEAVGVVFIFVGPPLTASTGLMIYDAVQAVREQPPSQAAGWVQTLGAGPQAIFLNGMGVYGAVDDDDNSGLIGLIFAPFAMMTTALMTHGIWTLALDEPDASQMFFTSTAIGINAPMSIWALSAGLAGGVSKAPYAIQQMVASAPVIGGSAYHLGIDGDHRIDAVVLMTWSSLLFVHGAISLMLPEHALDYDDDSDIALSDNALSDNALSDNALSDIALSDIALSPTALPDLSEDGRAPGMILSGRF